MSTATDLAGKSLGRYRIGSLLGRGGMGDVYRADDVELGRPVAIKVARARGPSPDGTMLAGMFREDPKAGVSIGVVDAREGRVLHTIPRFPSAGGLSMFGWLPDNRTLLFTTSERTNLWKQHIDGGEREKVTDFDEHIIVRFALSPDGRTLALCRGTIARDALLLTNFR